MESKIIFKITEQDVMDDVRKSVDVKEWFEKFKENRDKGFMVILEKMLTGMDEVVQQRYRELQCAYGSLYATFAADLAMELKEAIVDKNTDN